jgi:hypothetical protein
MRKILIGMTILLWILSACAPKAQPTVEPLIPNLEPSYPNPSYPNTSYPNGDTTSPTHIPVDLTPAQRAAIAALSSDLNLPADQIKLISTEAVTWPDGCLGVTRIGVMCTQAIVDGFKIVLEANGQQYEYHTNQDGSSAAQAVLSAGSTAVEDLVRERLASNLGLDKADISVVSDASVEFPDSCMGVAQPQIMCSQIVTPGRIIMLEANNVQYEYHTSEDGSTIQPATIALTWQRTGGIAGFCDSMTVFLSGEIYGNQCKAQPDQVMKTFTNTLSDDERKQFDEFIKQYGQVNIDDSSPKGVSDQMTVTLTLNGSGSKTTLAKPDREALMLWVQTVFQKLFS